MKKSILVLVLPVLFTFFSCKKNGTISDFPNDPSQTEPCDFKTELTAPEGFELNAIGDIIFEGSPDIFQFVSESTGFIMMSKNAGGHVAMLKTADGGKTWTDLEINIPQYPRGMVFKNENVGIITVHDVTGCPSNCQHKCVILKTENGGLDWNEIEIEGLKGILYHPQYDEGGILYANLSFDETSTLMKSTDDGENWETVYSSPDLGFSSVTFSFKLFEDRIFISGKEGKLPVVRKDGELLKTIETNEPRFWDLGIIDEANLIATVSGRVIKSINGGDSWEEVYDKSARIIGFETPEKGLMLLNESGCPGDVYQVNDLIASTEDGGLNWNEADETTTNLRIGYINSQKMDEGIWYVVLNKQLIEIKEL